VLLQLVQLVRGGKPRVRGVLVEADAEHFL
jgi:hypothetical protein